MKKVLITFLPILFVGCFSDSDIITFEEQLEIDASIIDNYLEENTISAEVHQSGIRYVVTQEGEGDNLVENDRFVVKYTGTVMGGEQFGESKYGSTFSLNTNLLVAWQIMFQEMNVGEKLTMYVPSGYGFGRNSLNMIPANSNLIFDVEVVRLIADEDEQFEADTTIINEYLADNELTAEVHSSGIRYIIESEGTGESPLVTDNVEIKYTGYFTDGSVFGESQNGVSFGVSGLIESWRIMLPEMKEGEKRTILTPSVYGYGTAGNETILPNTVLLFDIELVSIN